MILLVYSSSKILFNIFEITLCASFAYCTPAHLFQIGWKRTEHSRLCKSKHSNSTDVPSPLKCTEYHEYERFSSGCVEIAMFQISQGNMWGSCRKTRWGGGRGHGCCGVLIRGGYRGRLFSFELPFERFQYLFTRPFLIHIASQAQLCALGAASVA